MAAAVRTFILCAADNTKPSPPPPRPTVGLTAALTPMRRTCAISAHEVRAEDRRRRSSATAADPRAPVTAIADAAARLTTAVCDVMDRFINVFMDPPALRPFADPRNVLSGNWGPIGELPPTQCPLDVDGTIPRCLLGGAYIRNGPNPQYMPGRTHHLFDGDGMLHSLLLPTDSGHRPILCSRYVRTYKYQVEQEAGAALFPSFFAGFYGPAGTARSAVLAARVLAGQLDLEQGIGMANTSLAIIGGRLYALCESDLPYAVHVDPNTGNLSTLGRHDFKGRLLVRMTAHPKKDPVTGETFAFHYSYMPPFLTYFRFDAAGNKAGPDVPIYSFRRPSFVHDFAITENYVVFPDIQIVASPINMVLGRGTLVKTKDSKVSRLCVLPRYASDESAVRWFDVPVLNFLHVINAWEENNGEHLIVVGTNMLPVEYLINKLELVHYAVEMVRIDLRAGTVSRTRLADDNLEFGVIHPGKVGRRNRYAYIGIGDPLPNISGFVKLDFDRAGQGHCVVARRTFGPRCYAGEPFFVPDGTRDGEEDDGYIVCYVHDESSGASKFVVMDAKSPELDVVGKCACRAACRTASTGSSLRVPNWNLCIPAHYLHLIKPIIPF